jgi:hypothetical protein
MDMMAGREGSVSQPRDSILTWLFPVRQGQKSRHADPFSGLPFPMLIEPVKWVLWP